MEVKNVERELEKSLSIKWAHQKSAMSNSQEDFVDNMVDFLKENPEAKISIRPNSYELKEKEAILLFEAKKKYFLAYHQAPAPGEAFTLNDSVTVERMSIKDEGFKSYLNAQAKDSALHTAQDKAATIISQSLINTKYNNLLKARQTAFLEPFKAKNTQKQVVFLQNKNVIPFYGFSFFDISYKGDLPEDLIDAFRKMEELDREAPREEYIEKRAKNTANQ